MRLAWNVSIEEKGEIYDTDTRRRASQKSTENSRVGSILKSNFKLKISMTGIPRFSEMMRDSSNIFPNYFVGT